MVRAARRRLRQDETQTTTRHGFCSWTVAFALAADRVLSATAAVFGWPLYAAPRITPARPPAWPSPLTKRLRFRPHDARSRKAARVHHVEMAGRNRRNQPALAGASDQGAAGRFPCTGAHARAGTPLHAADAAARRRFILARASGSGGTTGAGTRPRNRSAPRLDVARGQSQERPADDVPDTARTLSGTGVCTRTWLLLRVRTAGLPVRLARRPVECRS